MLTAYRLILEAVLTDLASHRNTATADPVRTASDSPGWSRASRAAVSSPLCLHQLFKAQVTRTPEEQDHADCEGKPHGLSRDSYSWQPQANIFGKKSRLSTARRVCASFQSSQPR